MSAGGWAFRAVSSVATGTTSLTISKPSGTLDNDIMFMCLSHKGTGYATVPAGWTLVAQNISGATRGEMYWKRASSEGASYSVTGLADTACGFIVSYIGGLLSGDIIAASAAQANASGVETFPSILPTGPTQLVLAMVAVGANAAVTYPGAGAAVDGNPTYTEVQDGGTTNGTGCRIAVAHTIIGSTAATSLTYSITNAESVAIMAAFIPEPPAAAPTRFYPTVRAPRTRIDGPLPGTWHNTTVTRQASTAQWLLGASPQKANGGLKTDQIITCNSWDSSAGVYVSDFDLAIQQWNIRVAAGTISGNFNHCFMVNARWHTPTTNTPDSVVCYRVQIFLMVGETSVVRATLLDYVDSDNFTTSTSPVWKEFGTIPTLTSAVAVEGDTVRIVEGIRIRSAPTNPPLRPQPPFDVSAYYTRCTWNATGANSAANVGRPDAVPGETVTDRCAWFEFTGGLTLFNDSSAPGNMTCATALTIASAPGEVGPIDTTAATSHKAQTWYQYVATRTGNLFVTCLGSTYNTLIQVYEGTCGALVEVANSASVSTLPWAQRCASSFRFPATQGTTYFIRVWNRASTFNTDFTGGSLRVQVWYQETPEVDDLYLPANVLVQWRRYPNGAVWPVNMQPSLASSTPSGVAIDFTRRPMNDLNGGTNTNVRVLMAVFDSNTVEVLNAPDLSYGFIGQSEVDFISNVFDFVDLSLHPMQINITQAGALRVGWCGNGFLGIAGFGNTPSRNFDSTSDNAQYSAIRLTDSTFGDNQGAFPAASFLIPTVQSTAAWNIGYPFNGAATRVFFTSAGLYYTLGGQDIRTFDGVTTSVFATLPVASGTYNPGPKGLEVLSDGTVFVTNASVAYRLSAVGTILQTYTPSEPENFQTIGDIKVTADGTKVWIVDLDTATLALFDVATGAEIGIYPTWQIPQALVQMAIYQPDGVIPPPPPPDLEGCPDLLAPIPTDGVGCPSPLGPATTTGSGCGSVLASGSV